MATNPLDEVERVLIVQEPWASKLIDGEKTWELRKRRTTVRGQIGISASRTSKVIGTVELVDCHGPFTVEELEDHRDRHRVGTDFLTAYAGDGTLWAWEVTDAQRLLKPVPYVHPPGAVVWVDFTRGRA